MNKKIVFVLILLFCQKALSQYEEWATYDLDSIVYLDMPYSVYEIDTIINQNKFYQIYSENKSSKFTAQKIFLGDAYVNKLDLPFNKKS